MTFTCNRCGRGYFGQPPECFTKGCHGRVKQDLEDIAPQSHARSSDPDTSHEHLDSSRKFQTRNDHIILGVLRDHPEGLTSREVSAACSDAVEHVSSSTRMTQLRYAGLIERTGERRGGGFVCKLVVEPTGGKPF
jgi:hypothetical protein